MATSSLNKINKFVGESPSSVFCQEQINTLGMLLTRSDLLTSDTLEFLIDWLFLLVGSLGSGIQTICEKEELVSLRKVVLFLYFNGKNSNKHVFKKYLFRGHYYSDKAGQHCGQFEGI